MFVMGGKGESPAIGIDLGTTYSCVGVWQNDHVEIIPNDQGNRMTPSYVDFNDKERLIGDATKNQVARNPTYSIFGIHPILQSPNHFFFFCCKLFFSFLFVTASETNYNQQNRPSSSCLWVDH